MAEELGATSFNSGKGASGEYDVDALIAGALKELEEKKPVQKRSEEPALKATPMKPSRLDAKKPVPSQDEYEGTFKDFKVGAIVTGVVSTMNQSGVLVDIGYKSDGFVPNEEITIPLKVGDSVRVMIENLENKEGYVVLSKKSADFEITWEEVNEAFRDKSVLQAKVTGAVKGGLVVDFQGIRGFIPASQVLKEPSESLESFVGKMIPAKIIELNRRQSKVILSHKFGVSESKRSEAHKIFDELEAGQVRRGIVKSIKSFGAFVDLGGVEGLIHLTELSWKRVKHPSDVLKVGQELDVFVLGIDRAHNRISLGLKELQSDPWATVLEKYKAGQVVKVKVLRLAKFGAFVELEEGLEGLIHISELSKDKIDSPDKAVKPGDVVEAHILRIIPDEQKIGLSIKEVQLSKEKELAEEQKKEESKITIGEVLAQKEKTKAERDLEFAPEITEQDPEE
ncbi:S1 RNA-binding domain-containing protein [Candidatus Saganbacteria bacterium]|nr:S1 RNA-binding domain-containing protein [Candidatus Saganbacteria bacterium]